MLTEASDSLKYLLKIIMSNPFKVLQYKSQALPLNDKNVIHNRLTHSLEVAQISKQLAIQVYGNEASDQIIPIEIAGLVHDIGIPPFGHTGERSIREWCKTNCQNLMQKSIIEDHFLNDFTNFDGNAQGMRILLRYPFDTKITVSKEIILAYLKYNNLPSPSYKKTGYFYADKALFDSQLNKWNVDISIRPPVSYLVEMADDIAHSFGDITDCIQNKLVTFSHFKDWLLSMVDKSIKEYILNTLPDRDLDTLHNQFFSVLLNKLILEISSHYIKFDPKLINNDNKEFYNNPYLHLIKLIKKYVSVFLFTNEEKVHVDFAGYKAIHYVLDAFSRLLRLPREQFSLLVNRVDYSLIYSNGLDIEYKLASLLSKEWILVYLQENINTTDVEEWHLRMHLIIDTLTSMTNQAVLNF